jgi:hypothetical protein
LHFPEQQIDWEYLLLEFLSPSQFPFPGAPFQERMRFLVMCGISERVKALAFTVWRDYITKMIHATTFDYSSSNLAILQNIQDNLAHFEDELVKLKEVTSILEITLWKMNMNMNDRSLKENTTQHQKKFKTDESNTRQQCRVTCGADVVIGHVLPFLITA